jgi:hypothetical protein
LYSNSFEGYIGDFYDQVFEGFFGKGGGVNEVPRSPPATRPCSKNLTFRQGTIHCDTSFLVLYSSMYCTWRCCILSLKIKSILVMN